MADLDTKIDLPTLHRDRGDPAVATIDVANSGAFAENASISVAPGIAPVADYIPKDATTSHPTPPPDEPLATSEANVDVDMKADEVPKVESVPDPEPPSADSETPAAPLLPAEPSLVRPRDEDDEDQDEERAAKRNKVDDAIDQDVTLPDAPPVDATLIEPPPLEAETQPPPPEADSSLAASAEFPQASTEIESSLAASAGVPQVSTEAEEAKAIADAPSQPLPEVVTKSEPQAAAEEPASAPAESAPAETVPEPLPSDPPVAQDAPLTNGDHAPSQPPAALVPSTENEVSSTPKAVEAEAQSSQAPAQDVNIQPPAAPAKPTYSKSPLTQTQMRYLQEKLKNLKKTKHALSFLNPVDPVALSIPTYFDVIKNPMDLGTLENKLKTGKYESVQAFVDDFDLIIQNTRTFNGEAHAVTQAGYSMEAYMRKILETVPSANQPIPQKPQPKKASPKPQPRRESRSVAQPAAPPPAAPAANNAAESFALQADGTPQIRRDSTINRPARTIKPPPARELAYAKPKRKEHQLELKFCDHVLSEVKGPKYNAINSVFLHPVDPVALNIPHYRQVVKNPMDLSTMTQKLKQGQYGKASEFKKDFELMIQNCLIFNPSGNPVRDMGVAFKREFEALWQTKDKWEKAQKAEMQRGTSASADEYSGDEEEDEDEDGGDEDKTRMIAALQEQLKAIQGTLAGLEKPAKKPKKSAKSGASKSKKSGGGHASAKQKPAPKSGKAPKKPKQVTYDEKQEISDAVGHMNEHQVGELTKIITDNCKKYADQEEMELEIDDLPNDVQALLLTYVRKIFGRPKQAIRADSPDDAAALDDDDFEPAERGGRRGGGAGQKRKKHKPMHKEEQQKAINDLKSQLAQFHNPTSASPSQQDDTSGDESEESEEE